MDAQVLVGRRLEADARDLQRRVETFKTSAAPITAAVVAVHKISSQPEEPAHSEGESTDTANQALLELAEPTEPVLANIHILPKHVLHEERSVLPAKKHAYGTRTWNLHRHIKNSMANGLDLTECIQLPDGYQLTEWVAVHVVDFFNEISLLFGTISEFCTAKTCPQMTAGPCYTYLWADGAQHAPPIALPAPEYVDRLLHWVQDQLDTPQVFPLDGNYTDSRAFLHVAGVIFKRLFRVYAHMYHNHLETYAALHAEAHLNFCFKRFILFVKEFEMVDQKELNALRKLIQTITS